MVAKRYAIRSERERLLLIGATELGASHAAFAFLEHLGCRWFFPAKAWEVVPRQEELATRIDMSDRPRILARRIWYGYGCFSDKGHPQGGSAQKDYDSWARHNRMASSFRVRAGHAWENLILGNRKVFEQHPEYLALVKGKRTGPQLCVSRPEVRKMALEYALDYFRKHPNEEMVSMETSDGSDHCECGDCAKLGSISERAFGLANEVAMSVGKTYPGKQVGHLAYNDHCEPPSFQLEPNVYVQLTAGFIRGRYTHQELIDVWAKKTRNLGFYEYFSVWLWDFDKLPGGNGANIARTKNMIRRYATAGATSVDAESGNNWGPHGRGYYIANRLLWNPEADVEAYLDDFYDKAFGRGARAMKRYYERLAPENEPLLSRSLVGEALRDIQEASRLTQDRLDIQARLDQLKHYLHYVHRRWMLDNEPDKERRKDLTLEILKFVYRTRYEYMNHWAAIRAEWVEKAAKEFTEPSWGLSGNSQPWKVESQVTKEETERWFEEGLAYFQPEMVKETRFSEQLVPVDFTGARQRESQQHYQGGARYALWSRTGEALELEITPGTIAWYRDRADAKFTLTNSKGRTNSEGRLKLDGEVHKLRLEVPEAGLYFFNFDDSAAGWRIKAGTNQAISLLPQRGRGYMHQGHMPEMFFYVPKGTRQIQYFWNGSAHKVFDPEGKLKHQQKQKGEIVTIEVPAGMDGKCWSFRELQLGHLWFFNVPNCLSASPATLLLPKEVVKRDKLQQTRGGRGE